MVQLHLVSEFVRRTGTRELHTQRSPLGITGVVQQPEFQTSRIASELLVARDQPTLAGVFVLSEPDPHVELHIVRARATLLPLGTATPFPK
jgi:hypothetical protein